jgi:hypothetical protein
MKVVMLAHWWEGHKLSVVPRPTWAQCRGLETLQEEVGYKLWTPFRGGGRQEEGREEENDEEEERKKIKRRKRRRRRKRRKGKEGGGGRAKRGGGKGVSLINKKEFSCLQSQPYL